jgi:hypothetical protein
LLAGAGVRSSRVLAGVLRRATRGRRPRAPLARREASAPTRTSAGADFFGDPLHGVVRPSLFIPSNHAFDKASIISWRAPQNRGEHKRVAARRAVLIIMVPHFFEGF